MAQGNEQGVVTTPPGTITITNVQMSPLPRLVLDDDGIRVRNGLFFYRIGWDQVRLLTDGSWRGQWALRIERHRGRAVTCTATADADRQLPGRPEMVAAIRQAAGRHDIPTALTGPTERAVSAQPTVTELDADGLPVQPEAPTAFRFRLAAGLLGCGVVEVGLVAAEIFTHRRLPLYLTVFGWVIPFTAAVPAGCLPELPGSDKRTKRMAKYAALLVFLTLIAWVIATGHGDALNNAG
jgi:hypothetical protein